MCIFAGFIEATREEVKIMKEKISAPAGGKSQRLSNLVSFNLFITVQETDCPLSVCTSPTLHFLACLKSPFGFNTLRHNGPKNQR